MTANDAIINDGILNPNNANVNIKGYSNTLHHASFYCL
jgi:hypothetical protein